MNIFFLSKDPVECSMQHVDKHVVKMILEYGLLMSTAHRVLDGEFYVGRTAGNRKIARWLLPDERENKVWKASHIKHPSNLWIRSSKDHYTWLYSLWIELLKEYTYRYDRNHKSEEMKEVLLLPPKNIPDKGWLGDPTPAMPDVYKVDDSINSYRNYYRGDKRSFANWKKRSIPFWFN